MWLCATVRLCLRGRNASLPTWKQLKVKLYPPVFLSFRKTSLFTFKDWWLLQICCRIFHSNIFPDTFLSDYSCIAFIFLLACDYFSSIGPLWSSRSYRWRPETMLKDIWRTCCLLGFQKRFDFPLKRSKLQNLPPTLTLHTLVKYSRSMWSKCCWIFHHFWPPWFLGGFGINIYLKNSICTSPSLQSHSFIIKNQKRKLILSAIYR